MCIQSFAFADQLLWINKNDAIKAVNFLNHHSEAMLFCGCCDEDVQQEIHIYSARYSQVPEDKSFYKVSLTYGYNGDSIAGWLDVDLAYIHTEIDGLWTSVGKYLGMECDPCIMPFTTEKTPATSTNQLIESGFKIGEFAENSVNSEHYLNIISTTDLGFKFKIQVGTESMCIGELSGTANYTSNKKVDIFKGSNGCSMIFSVLPSGIIDVSEDNCADFHGVRCSFDAQFFRKK
jgi:hypothetical protein